MTTCACRMNSFVALSTPSAVNMRPKSPQPRIICCSCWLCDCRSSSIKIWGPIAIQMRLLRWLDSSKHKATIWCLSVCLSVPHAVITKLPFIADCSRIMARLPGTDMTNVFCITSMTDRRADERTYRIIHTEQWLHYAFYRYQFI